MPVKKASTQLCLRIVSLKMDKSKTELCFGKILQIDFELFYHFYHQFDILNMLNPDYSVGHCDALFN